MEGIMHEVATLGGMTAPIDRLVQEGPLIYSLFLIIIALLIGALWALYTYMSNDRNFWRETAKELQSELIAFLNNNDVQ